MTSVTDIRPTIAPLSLTTALDGLDIHQREGRLKRSQRIGMMFQNPDDQIIFPTVEEELALGLPGLKKLEALQKAREFLAQRGLSDWAQRAISALSQGQRQHVCWLTLLLAGPATLLLDEPFSSLDTGLMAATLAWAHGSTLATAIDDTPIQAGDFVRWMRQVMDCLGQIASASSSAELTRKAEAAKERIGRGIVAWSTI